MKKILITLITTLFFCSSSFAKDKQNPIDIFVFHINGINTKAAEAVANLRELKKAADVDASFIKWEYLYNPTYGVLSSDLWDTFRMKKQEGRRVTVDDYVLTYMKSLKEKFAPGSPEYEKLKASIKKIYLKDKGLNLDDLITQFHMSIKPPYQELANFLRNYKEERKQLPFVLLVPHSQGNQYTNQLWNYLVKEENFPKGHLETFGIASPASKTSGDLYKNYITATNDYVINSLRLLMSLAPKSRRILPGITKLQCNELLCHNLIETYLYDPYGKQVIQDGIRRGLDLLYSNLIEEEKEKRTINFVFDAYLENPYLLLVGAGKIICNNGKCDESFYRYAVKEDSILFKRKYGYLDPGPYVIFTTIRTDVIIPFVGYTVAGQYYTYQKCDPNSSELLPVPNGIWFEYFVVGVGLRSCDKLPLGNILLGNFLMGS